MRISDWSSDVCSSDLLFLGNINRAAGFRAFVEQRDHQCMGAELRLVVGGVARVERHRKTDGRHGRTAGEHDLDPVRQPGARSEEHTSELQSLMRISYAVFCLKKKTL